MGCCKWCCVLLLVTVVVIGASLGLFSAFFPYPSHASCRVDWRFGKSCGMVKDTIINQIEAWEHSDCTSHQMCNYKYIGEKRGVVIGEHVTPVMRFVDRFNFTFEGDGSGCKVQGASESQASYAVIDFGANYCNLRNLIIGSRLDEDDSYYKENSTNAVCTMYSIAHCNLYT